MEPGQWIVNLGLGTSLAWPTQQAPDSLYTGSIGIWQGVYARGHVGSDLQPSVHQAARYLDRFASSPFRLHSFS